MVLKGIVFGMIIPLSLGMVLKGATIVAYWLQVGSIAPVDSAVGALDGVGASTI